MPIKTKVVTGILGLTLNAALAGSAPELSSTEVYQRAVPSTLALEVTTFAGEEFVGAAFVVTRRDLAVTAWHLVQQARSIRGRLSDGTSVEVSRCGAEDELHDLALLKISPGTASPLPLSVAQPAIASRIYAIGSPRGYAFSISDGLLSQVHSIVLPQADDAAFEIGLELGSRRCATVGGFVFGEECGTQGHDGDN